jgi:ectoine hydroxylase-related dioxygenase (phytanoyl-CoA dioxygenase family)
LEGNAIEALIKPLEVVEGISDLPWHKDCSLGRHSYDCCSLTVGISVTGAGADSGQLRVIAGSHRALMWPAHLNRPEKYGLPIVDLPTRTGDITAHLSCTHHMAQAPTARERRVMYTSFRLPSVAVDSSIESRARINQAREAAYKTVSQ